MWEPYAPDPDAWDDLDEDHEDFDEDDDPPPEPIRSG
jgi:hypothetical protein